MHAADLLRSTEPLGNPPFLKVGKAIGWFLCWTKAVLGSLEFGPFQSQTRASLVAQTVKSLRAMQETQVQSLGQIDTLEKGMATHPGILAWTVPWTEGAWWAIVHGSQGVGHDWVTDTQSQTNPQRWAFLHLERSKTAFAGSKAIPREGF